MKLDYDVSRARFADALALATSSEPLDKVWLDRARRVGASPSSTFVAVFGTALLAKATDPRVDPFALKVRDYPRAYSARSLCKDVLVPCAVKAAVHLGVTGREPLNNQPFFRHERIAPDMTVKPYIQAHLDHLCECLAALKKLDQRRSLEALAAFLRVRIEDGPKKAAPLRVEKTLDVPGLVTKTNAFISRNPENGKRGQALVAAALSLVFRDVRTTRINDPSRHWPGDVVAYDEGHVVLAAEVKQRPATGTEILQFVERCRSMGVERALVAALDPNQDFLDVDELRAAAWERHQVCLSVLGGAGDLIWTAITWASKTPPEALRLLPIRVAERLEEMEASAEGQAEWSGLFKAGS